MPISKVHILQVHCVLVYVVPVHVLSPQIVFISELADLLLLKAGHVCRTVNNELLINLVISLLRVV